MFGGWEVQARRPVLWILPAYIAGIMLSAILRADILLLFLIMLGTILAAAFLRRAMFLVILCLAGVLGLLRGNLYYLWLDQPTPFSNQAVVLAGEVSGSPQAEPGEVHLVLKLKSVAVKGKSYAADDRVRISVYLNNWGEPVEGQDTEVIARLKAGDLVEARGTLKVPTGPRNPGGFDYKSYLARRGIRYIMTAEPKDITLLREGSPYAPANILSTLRERAAAGLEAAVGGVEGDLLKAMLLGQSWLIDSKIRDSFSRTGLAHILAISGLHVGFIALLLNKVSELLGLRNRGAFIFKTLTLALYCLLVGATASVVRATIMAVILYAGQLLRRKPDMLNSTAVAAFVILLIKPMDVYEPGFQLSFVTVVSIALFYKGIMEKIRILPAKIAAIFAVTLSAQLGAMPLIAYHFNIVSLSTLAANPLLIPLFGLLVMAGFIIMPIGILVPGLSSYPGLALKLVCRLLLDINAAISSLPGSFITVISPSIAAILVFYLVLWIISRERPAFIRKPAIVSAMLVLVFLTGSMIWHFALPRDLEVVFLDVGQGDCAYIRTPDGLDILVDGGGRPMTDTGEDVVIPFLLKKGVSSLDLVIMSHCHDDHIKGLVSVIERMRVDCFMEFPPLEPGESYAALKSAVAKRVRETYCVTGGEVFKAGRDLTLNILYPKDTVAKELYGGDENNNSLVIRLDYKDTSILFTGDIEGPVEQYLVKGGLPSIDILKVPHHGSKTSSTQAFLEALSPNIGVIQVGSNSFGHPSPEVLERMEELGIDIYRNDINGAVVCRYRDGRWTISTMLPGE